jgi:hypothetical protein
MNEVLDVIFTHEKGQNQITIPLPTLSKAGFFEDKEKFEFGLLSFFEAATTFRAVGVDVDKAGKIPRLVKISTCIYTETDFLPEWYEDWNGKFYYELQ